MLVGPGARFTNQAADRRAGAQRQDAGKRHGNVAVRARNPVVHGIGHFQRCGHPGQQHGRRMPLRILSRPISMRRFLVSTFLADVTQQIHSLRASGVMPAHTSATIASDTMALRRSAGVLCTVPEANGCRAMVARSLQGVLRSANAEPNLRREKWRLQTPLPDMRLHGGKQGLLRSSRSCKIRKVTGPAIAAEFVATLITAETTFHSPYAPTDSAQERADVRSVMQRHAGEDEIEAALGWGGGREIEILGRDAIQAGGGEPGTHRRVVPLGGDGVETREQHGPKFAGGRPVWQSSTTRTQGVLMAHI